MAKLENVIRPFVGRDLSPAIAGVDSIPSVMSNVVLLVGQSGSGKVWHGSFSSSYQGYMTKHQFELGDSES